MQEILHQFPIKASANKVFDGIATPAGLDQWWTKTSAGKPAVGETYELFFGETYNWRAIVTKCIPNQEFELEMTGADADWLGTKIGFVIKPTNAKGNTVVEFYHTGWAEKSDHYRISSFCWAMYLRILKRYLEFGEEVAYEKRLSV